MLKMLTIKSYLRDQSTVVRIVIYGGDRTIGRMLNELEPNDKVLDKCIFGGLPIGRISLTFKSVYNTAYFMCCIMLGILEGFFV